jgi:hypothetical protein
LNVVELDEDKTPEYIIQLFKETSESEMMEKFSDEKLYSDVRIDVEADYNAWMGIVNYAKIQNNDLIIMNTHWQQKRFSDFLGNIAEKVIQEAPCPVLTMKPVN